jgi:hypothetical protein
LAEVCCCGNTLRETSISIRIRVCRCAKPGKGKRHDGRPSDLSMVGRVQYLERKAHGLPLVTDFERAAFKGW